jgi:hypothetical protein
MAELCDGRTPLEPSFALPLCKRVIIAQGRYWLAVRLSEADKCLQ